MKMQPTKWQKIFTTRIFHKRLISKIDKELDNETAKKKKNQLKNEERT